MVKSVRWIFAFLLGFSDFGETAGNSRVRRAIDRLRGEKVDSELNHRENSFIILNKGLRAAPGRGHVPPSLEPGLISLRPVQDPVLRPGRKV